MGKIISRLVEMIAGLTSDNDIIPIQDVSVPKTKFITIANLRSALIKAGSITMDKLVAQDTWHEVSYQSGWVAYDNFEWLGVSYFKDRNNIVHMRGLMKSGTATNGTIVTTLPAGYRPINSLLFEVTSTDARARIDILPNGQIRLGAGVNSSWISFANVSFLAEA